MLQHIVPIVFSILFGGLIFYLLRKKITNIENKVNLMFQLIQEHEKKEQLRNTSQQTSVSQNSNSNLIDVSDGDDESVEESESEDEIVDNLSSTENSKQIAMNLISQIDNTLNMTDGITQQNTNNHDSETDDESEFDTDETDNDSDKLNIQGSIESLEQNKIINLNVDDNNSLAESISLTEIKNISKTEDNPNDTTLDKDKDVNNNLNSENLNKLDATHANDKDVGNSDLDDVNLDDESDNEDHSDKGNKKKSNINAMLKNYTVSELKKECTKRNLSNFKSLKKNDLIELLENS